MSTTVPTTTRELALAIADEIEAKGHFPRNLEGNSVCLVSNSYNNQDPGSLFRAYVIDFRDWLRDQGESVPVTVIGWNDNNTTEHVLARLREFGNAPSS